jgi:hypothetical protein
MTEAATRLFRSGRRNRSEAVAERIAGLLQQQGLQPGDRLPPERELVNAFHVALATVRRALALLEQRGLVRRVARSGTFYAGLPEQPAAPPTPPAASPEPPGSLPVPTIFTPTVRTLAICAKELTHPGCRQRWEALAQRAAAALPHTRIRLLPPTPEHLLESPQGQMADVLLGTEYELDELERAGRLQPLGELPWLRAEEYFACTHRALGPPTARRAVPYAISAGMKLWHAELLAAAGAGPQAPPRTSPAVLRPLLAALAARQRPALAATFVHAPLYQWLEDGPLAWDPATGSFTLDTTAAADSLAFHCAMVQQFRRQQRRPVADPRHFDPADIWRAFVEGRVLVMDTFSYALGHFPRPPDFPMQVQAPPLFPGDTVAAHTSLLALGSACVERERALEFLRFAAGPEGQQHLAETRHNIPAHRVVALGETYLGHGPPGLAALLANLDQPHSIFHDCPIVRDGDLSLKGLEAALACYAGERTIPETLAILQAVLRLVEARRA